MVRIPLLITALFLLTACSSSPAGTADDSTPAAQVGGAAPGFTLPDETGQDQSLAALHDGQYVILAFNRGLW